MEMFCLLRLHCPRLAVQSFGQFLFDFQCMCMSIKTYLFQQLSISFDVYIAILDWVRRRVLKAVQRDTPHWRIQNSCPSWTYQLKDEPKLRFSMLVAYDGNNSAKRILCQREAEEDGVGKVTEREDDREGGRDYFLARQVVEKWSKECIEDMLNPVSQCAILIHRS